jgi:GxxExxY protein
MSIWTRLGSVFRRRKSTSPKTIASNAVNQLAEQVIACANQVWAALGSGLTEVIYENALAHALRKAGLTVSQKLAVSVCYDGMIVGDYVADLLVDHAVVIELTAANAGILTPATECANYLKATGHPLCLQVDFGTRGLRIKRVINNC